MRCVVPIFIVFNLSTNSFSYMRYSSGDYLLGFVKDPNYSRFYLQSVSSHPDFSASSLTMNVYTTGDYDFVSDAGPMIATASLPPTISNLNTYTNTSLTYQSSSTNSFTLLVNTKAESYLSLLENSYIEVSPTLTCSSISSTSIVYSISSYNGVTAPSWVAIDSSSGLLKISTPNVTSPTSCSFFIDSQVSSVTNPIQKLINLKVTKCLAQNCQKCNSLDSSKCNSCNSYYYLSNGYCGNEVKSTIKTLSITTNSIIAGATIIVILASTVHSASFSSLWAIINQLQLFLLLILTRVYLPLDVINFIIGSKIAMFPYDYIPFKKSSYSGSINDLFDSEQNDEILSKIGLESASSFVNNYSLFSSLLSAVLLHLSVIVANILLNKCEVKGKCAKPFKALKWLTQKVFTILTFGYYIRTVIESYQFLLVSSVSEINSFNVKSSSHISSLVVAFLILIVCIVFAVIAFVLASASNPKSNNEHNKLGELYAGLKNTREYLTLLCSNNFIIFLIVLIATCIIMAKKAREKCCTPKIIEPKIRQNAEETKSEMRIVKKDWS